MNDIVSLAIPATTLLRLLQFAGTQPGAASASELAVLAIEEWLDHAQAGHRPAVRRRGYQWKSLFLPEGTQLRAFSRAGYVYAEVIGDDIIHQDQPVSPHQFICSCKGISRSAWTEIALLFPHADAWQKASACRDAAQPPGTPPAPTPSCPQPGPTPATAPVPTPAPARPRLPRIPPIPTQARLQPPRAPTPPLEDIWPTAHDRRRSHRRAEDLLLD